VENIPNNSHVYCHINFVSSSRNVGKGLISLNHKCWSLRASVQQQLPLAVSAACLQSVITFRTVGQTWIGQRAHLPVSSSGVSQVVVTWFLHSTSIAPLLKVWVLKEKLGLMIKPHSWNVEALYHSKWWNIFRCLYPKQPKEMWNCWPVVVCNT
jgi:hypothetical protein